MPRRTNGHRRPRIHLYRTYPFGHKDPVIAKVQALQEEEGMRASEAALIGGLSPHTPTSWRKADGVRRPQFASIAAYAAALGYDITFKKRRVQRDLEAELRVAKEEARERKEHPLTRLPNNLREYEFA